MQQVLNNNLFTYTKLINIDINGFLSPQEKSGKDVECVMDASVMTARNVASVWINLSMGGMVQ